MGNQIITIGREYGSGGRLVAQKLAKRLGFAYYDTDLITMAAEKTGLLESFVKDMEQKYSNGFFYNLFSNGQDLSFGDQIFIAQSEVIRSLAEKGDSIFVGRCADYILKEHHDCVNVFLYAPLECRIERICCDYGECDSAHGEALIHRKDKERASYYNYFTTGTWGHYKNYHLSIDSSIGVDAVVDVIESYIKINQNKSLN